jgi:hypothetical protein
VTGEPARSCPSSSCAEGHLLIGIVRPDGTIAPVRPPLELDAPFVRRAEASGRAPESRMRFAGPCVTDRCRHWIAGPDAEPDAGPDARPGGGPMPGPRCGLADLVADAAPAGPEAAATPLPPCAIRSTCRWWAQRGASACRVCPQIVHTRTTAGQDAVRG